jgi:predicted anti-sigma-YlaC factor YlaD
VLAGVTCREVVDTLADYLSGEIRDVERERVESHLGECLDCRHYLDGYRETIRASRAAYRSGADLQPSEIPEALVRTILRSRRDARL